MEGSKIRIKTEAYQGVAYWLLKILPLEVRSCSPAPCMYFTSKAAGSRLSVVFSTGAQAGLGCEWRPCSSLVTWEQKWVFLEWYIGGESPPLLVSKAPGSSTSSALQYYPQLSLASFQWLLKNDAVWHQVNEFLVLYLSPWTVWGTKNRDPKLENDRQLLRASVQPDSR